MRIFNDKLPEFSACLLGFALIGGFLAAQSNHWDAIKERGRLDRFIDQKIAEYEWDTRRTKKASGAQKKPAAHKTALLFKPRNERERQAAIADLLNIKGNLSETKIFTPRMD